MSRDAVATAAMMLIVPVYVFIALLVLASIILFGIGIHRLVFHPLARVPGPRLAVLTSGWLAYQAREGRMATLYRLHEKYGSAVRVSPTEVWFNTEEAFKAIYSPGGCEKSDFYSTPPPLFTQANRQSPRCSASPNSTGPCVLSLRTRWTSSPSGTRSATPCSDGALGPCTAPRR